MKNWGFALLSIFYSLGSAHGDFLTDCKSPANDAERATVSAILRVLGLGDTPNERECKSAEIRIRSTESLSLSGKGLSDVSILKYFTKLSVLNLAVNRITDLSGLAELRGLKTLILSHNQLEDLSPIGQLESLNHLELNYSGVTDLGPLSGLKALKNLSVVGLKLKDIASLSSLSKLQFLWAAENQIVDIEPLKELWDLRILSVLGSSVKDYSVLAHLATQHEDSVGQSIALKVLGQEAKSPTTRVTPRPCPPRYYYPCPRYIHPCPRPNPSRCP